VPVDEVVSTEAIVWLAKPYRRYDFGASANCLSMKAGAPVLSASIESSGAKG